MSAQLLDQNALHQVLPFWFGDITQDKPFDMQSIQMQRWYGKSPDIDLEIKDKFEANYIALRDNETLSVFAERSIEEQLAVVITLDQFPRNMYRDTARMYEADAGTLELANHLVTHTDFATLDLFKQMFAAVPLMHIEDLAVQDQMLAIFKSFVTRSKQAEWPNTEFFENALQFGHRHRDIVDVFGRFPHRNEILNRESSKIELEFLTQPNSSF